MDQINNSIALLQTGFVQLQPGASWRTSTRHWGRINPELPALYTNAGIITNPNYLSYVSEPTTTTPLDRGVRRLQPDAGVQRSVGPGHE